MTPREHARWARALIQECGGIDEAAAGDCPVGRSSLSNYQNPNVGAFMPAHVIAYLEGYCGKPVYSRALFEQHHAVVAAASLRDEACEAVEATAVMMGQIRLATQDGELTPNERDALAKFHRTAEDELRQVGQLINRDAG